MKRVFYIGDSTVQLNKIDTYPQTGMSQVLELFMAPDVRVEPYGKNGCSTKSFLDQGLFAPVQEQMGEGDFLLIQFGHNDNKEDPLRHTDPYGSFQENLRFYIREAQCKGAHPVLVTPISRRYFDKKGNFYASHGEYPEAMRQVGREESVPVADLTALTEQYLTELGNEASKPLFIWPVDNTHLKYDGAVKMCAFLCEELSRFGAPYVELLYRGGSCDG